MLRRLFSTPVPEQLSHCLRQLQSQDLYTLPNQQLLCSTLQQASNHLQLNRTLHLDLNSHPSVLLIAAQAGQLSPSTLFQCVLYLSAGNIRNAQVWTALQPFTLKALSSLSPFNVALTTIACSNSGVADPSFWQELEKTVISVVLPSKVIDAGMLVQLWHAFERSPLNTRKGLMVAMEPELERLLEGLKVWEVTYIVRAYLAQRTGNERLLVAIDRKIQEKCAEIEPKMQISILFLLLKRNPLPIALISTLESALLPNFPSFGSQTLKLLTVYALHAPSHPPSRAFLLAWVRLIEHNYERLLPKDAHMELLDLMWSLSVLQIRQSPGLLDRLLADLRSRDVPCIEDHIMKVRTIRNFYLDIQP